MSAIIKVVTPSENGFDDAAEFVSAFKDMTDASADVFDKLSKIGSAQQKDSDELRAIQALQRQITEQFEALSRKIDDTVTVSYNIRLIERHMDNAVKAPGRRSLERIRSECEHSEHRPMRLLEWINEIANINCCLPTKNDAATYANATFLISKLNKTIGKQTNGITNSSEYKAWRSDVLVRLMEMPPQMTNKHVSYLDDALSKNTLLNFTNAKSLFDISKILVKFFLLNTEFAFFHADVHRIRSESQPDMGCFLSTISNRYIKRREPLLQHGNFIITDVVRLQLLGVMCEAFVAEADDEFHHLQLNQYDQLTKEIARALSAWINADLDSAWPDIIVSQAILVLQKNKGAEGHIEEDKYDKTAISIQKIANERGQQKYLHQVVVSPAWEVDLYFVMKCKGDFCTKIYKKHGVNVVISRFDEREKKLVDRLELSRKQIQQHRVSLQESIKSQLYQLGGTCDLNLMLTKSKIGQPFSFGNYLFGQHFWRSFILLHNRKFFAQGSVIPIGLAGVTIDGMNAYDDETIVFDNAFFSDANIYKLILML
ncbi:hypothetical protein niasHT_025138 [Heterodera trifolii]|uniref:Uncharacterized protein n=1 Tax=Heterodera trifolii TaxID=157864 RepID=A0ABD2K1D7_9BILA